MTRDTNLVSRTYYSRSTTAGEDCWCGVPERRYRVVFQVIPRRDQVPDVAHLLLMLVRLHRTSHCRQEAPTPIIWDLIPAWSQTETDALTSLEWTANKQTFLNKKTLQVFFYEAQSQKKRCCIFPVSLDAPSEKVEKVALMCESWILSLRGLPGADRGQYFWRGKRGTCVFFLRVAGAWHLK